jgi:hypothetical protein
MGKIKGILALLILVGGAYLAWELFPPYFHRYELQDDLDDIARVNSYNQKSDDDVRAIVIKHAIDLDIPLKENEVTISRTGSGLGISVHYHVHVDMVVHPVDLDFTANSLNKRL